MLSGHCNVCGAPISLQHGQTTVVCTQCGTGFKVHYGSESWHLEPLKPPPQQASHPPQPVPQWPAGRVVLLLGAVALVVGSMLPWVTASTAFMSVSRSGVPGDGVITLIIGLIVGLGALIARAKPGKRLGLAYSIFGLIAGAIALLDMTNVGDVVASANEDTLIYASVGIGLYVVAIGAVLVFVGGLMRWPEVR
ncbi:MAG: hypothetical protein M5R40_01630 [Anaerolineae bacterium]|nr:hypothetical protein [Anaerolineae bacterium]